MQFVEIKTYRRFVGLSKDLMTSVVRKVVRPIEKVRVRIAYW